VGPRDPLATLASYRKLVFASRVIVAAAELLDAGRDSDGIPGMKLVPTEAFDSLQCEMDAMLEGVPEVRDALGQSD
jgi:hypothetical protein